MAEYIYGQSSSFMYEAAIALNGIGIRTSEDMRTLAQTRQWKELELAFLKRRADSAQKEYIEAQTKLTERL